MCINRNFVLNASPNRGSRPAFADVFDVLFVSDLCGRFYLGDGGCRDRILMISTWSVVVWRRPAIKQKKTFTSTESKTTSDDGGRSKKTS